MIILDDSELEIDVYSKTCARCKNLDRSAEGRACRAFEDIPLEIWQGNNDHTKPYEGDGGILFEPLD